MSQYLTKNIVGLIDPATKKVVGIKAFDGVEYFFGSDVSATTVQPYKPGSVAVTGGTINGATIGQTTPAAVKASNYQANLTDTSGTPGNGTINNPRGRAAFAAGASTVTITNSLVTTTSSIFPVLETNDSTLLNIKSIVPSNGSFVVTGNAAATAITKFSFLVVN